MKRLRVFYRLRRHRQGVAAVLLAGALAFLTSQSAWAIDVSAPITASNGAVGCATCVTESAPSQYSIAVQTATQETGAIAPSSQTTYPLFSAGASANPAFRAIAEGDLPNLTSANWASHTTDETGTGVLVFGTNPSLTGVTVTGTAALTGATVNLPSGAVDAIGEIADGIKQGGGTAVKLATTPTLTPTANNCAKWDANGNLTDSGGTCGGSSLNPISSFSSETKVIAGTTGGNEVYMSLGGNVSTTEATVETPITNTMTFGNLTCVASAATTQAITVVLGTGACGSTISYTSKAQVAMSASANTYAVGTGNTAVTGGQCVVLRLSTSTGTSAAAFVHCSVERTA